MICQVILSNDSRDIWDRSSVKTKKALSEFHLDFTTFRSKNPVETGQSLGRNAQKRCTHQEGSEV
jgi:hypothetical protein